MIDVSAHGSSVPSIFMQARDEDKLVSKGEMKGRAKAHNLRKVKTSFRMICPSSPEGWLGIARGPLKHIMDVTAPNTR